MTMTAEPGQQQRSSTITTSTTEEEVRMVQIQEGPEASSDGPKTWKKDGSTRTAATAGYGDSLPSISYHHHEESTSSSDDDEDNTSSNENSQQNDTVDKEKKKTTSSSTWKRINLFRKFCGAIVNDDRTQLLIIFLIVVNAILMGIGTLDVVTEQDHIRQAFEKTDTAFLIIFTIELGLQFIYHGWKLFTDGWLLFDFIIILMSWSLDSMQIIRSFRIFRALRLVTRLTVLRNLVLALFAVAPSMGAIVCLLLLILYIYAVMCTVLFKDLHDEGITDDNYFGRLDTTLFTLFQMMTLEWADIVRQVMTEYRWAWAVFGTFLVMTSFILYSLIIAVVCDAVTVTEHSEEMELDLEERKMTRQRVHDLQQRVHELTVQQHAALASIKTALQLLNQERSLSLPSSQSRDDELDGTTSHAVVMDSSSQRRQQDLDGQLDSVVRLTPLPGLDGVTSHAVVLELSQDDEEEEDDDEDDDGAASAPPSPFRSKYVRQHVQQQQDQQRKEDR